MKTVRHPSRSGTRQSRLLIGLGLAACLCCMGLPAAQAHRSNAASEVSALSFLPVAVSVAAPAALLSVGAVYTVKAVELSAEGTVWVLERASDGAVASITLAGAAAGGVSVLAGATVSALACSAGVVLHSGGRAIAIVPNAVGQALLYNERVSR